MTNRLRQSFHRLRSFFRRAQLDRDLDTELRSHLEMAFEGNLAKGMSPEQAATKRTSTSGVLNKRGKSIANAAAFPHLTPCSRTSASPFACFVNLPASPASPS